jgi:hypothetical protein
MGDVTDLLRRAHGADPAAIDEIVALLYHDLRRMARAKLAANDTITLLDTTSMVNEVYLKLQHAARIDADCRGQFLAYAAQAMRSVIVDYAARRADCRGAWPKDAGHRDLDDRRRPTRTSNGSTRRSTNCMRPTCAQAGRRGFFGGLTSRKLRRRWTTERTVRRDWERARMLLSVALRP